MKKIIISIIALVALCSCTESTQRAMKSLSSDWNGGLYRRVEVYDYSGNMLRQYEGKFDVEETSSDYIYFDDQDGKRVIIHGGIIINEEIKR